MTYPHITNKLERKILAGALWKFRSIPKQKVKAKYLTFISSVEPGIMDECIVEVADWKFTHINYSVYSPNGKVKTKTISLSSAAAHRRPVTHAFQ